MLIKTSASFIKEFIDSLNESLKELNSNARLTGTQKIWLGFCLMGILMLNAVNWAKFERAGLGSYKSSALSWMLHHAKIKWELLLRASVMISLKQHGIIEGTLVLDESDRARSKRTRFIYKVHKQKDKATGGYVNGQTIVLLLLVTETITFPVGFAFYMPDPVVSAWKKGWWVKPVVSNFWHLICRLRVTLGTPTKLAMLGFVPHPQPTKINLNN